MADYPISNVARRIVYTGSAGVGPYAFPFEVLLNTDIKVYKNDVLLTLTTDYTVTISPSLGTGSVTLVSAATGSDRITIVGARPVERTTDFTTGGDFFANTLNDELDSQTILTQQVAETAERAIKAPVTDPTTINMTLPINTARAGKTLAFDANGNPVAGDPIGNWRGDWASGTSYQNRDIIKDTTNTNVYLCLVTHTSSGSLPITTNTDSAKWALVVDAAAAGASASAAAASASAASTSATNAASSASAASTSATNAASSASTASTAATNAGNSATAAASSASTASTAATNASNSATSASTSATNASNSASSASSSASTATTQASNASTSATNAASSASAASTSASNAATSATNAANSATSASTSATAAQSAQTAAESARDSTLAAFDSFDDRYLGTKTSDPTLDNDGNALVAGALYFNSVDGVMKVYTGSAWVAAYVSGTGFVAKSGDTMTGAFGVTTGSVTAPGLFASGDTNTGIFFPAADTIAFTEGGVEGMRIDSSGNVGIGTNSPSGKLDVTGSLGKFTIDSSGTLASLTYGSANYIRATTASGNLNVGAYDYVTIQTGSGFTERMRINSSGNVGIGTNNPTQRLQVEGSQLLSSPGNSVYTYFDSTASWVGRDSASGALVFGANSSERMRITTAGGVAFGGASNFGSSGQILQSNGNAAPTWVTPSGGGFTQMQIYTSGSGTWTIPAGITACKITVVGGGGGGGGVINTNTTSSTGAGGGGGGAAIRYYTGLTPGNTINYTVGGGGSAGAGGGGTGGTGGTSSVSSGTQTITSISATGGAGGVGVNYVTGSATGGDGGSGSGGNLNTTGGGGSSSAGGTSDTSASGAGGSSIFGAGGKGFGSLISGSQSGSNYGGGGGGARNGASQGNRAGGAGGAGVVIIEF